MVLRLITLLLLLLAGAAPAHACSDPDPVETRLGVMANGIQKPAVRTATELALGVRYVRPNAALIDATAPQVQNASSQAAGLKTVVTFVNRGTGASGQPVPPPTDLTAYGNALRTQLRLNRPALAVIENEEIAPNFYSGTPEQYLAQLRTAVRVAHEEGYEITNGGLVSNATALMTWDDLWSRGERAAADDYARRVWDPSRPQERRILLDIPTSANPTKPILGGSASLRALYDRAKTLIAGYRDSDMDYVNFHWYHVDTGALRQSITFLERFTGKPAVTNEIGQYDSLPSTTTGILRTLVDEAVPYALWYAADGPPSYGLYDAATQVLRPNGIAFRDFARAHVFGEPVAGAKPCRPATVRWVRRAGHKRLVRIRLHCRKGGRTCGGRIRAKGVRRDYAVKAGRSRTIRIHTRGRKVTIRRDSGTPVVRHLRRAGR